MSCATGGELLFIAQKREECSFRCRGREVYAACVNCTTGEIEKKHVLFVFSLNPSIIKANPLAHIPIPTERSFCRCIAKVECSAPERVDVGDDLPQAIIYIRSEAADPCGPPPS